MFSSILFIEDLQGQRELTERLYQMCAKSFHGEVEFATAVNWKSGMAYHREKNADVILLDLTLPPMGWKDTLEAMRHEPNLPPVVVLTGNDVVPDIREQCILSGADDFMFKMDANHHPEQLCEKAYNAYLRRQRDEQTTRI